MRRPGASRNLVFLSLSINEFGGIEMSRIWMCCLAAVLIAAPLSTGFAQAGSAAPTSDEAKPSRMKLSMQKLKEMKATWNANKPKLKACRQEVKAKGLSGDDRWFYIQDCMSKG
jgi:hypothetical protein